MIKNYFYTTEIAEQIRKLFLDNTTEEQLKNISIGDLSTIPSPEEVQDYVPMLQICPIELDADIANESWNISRTLYPYSLYYISAYNFKMRDEMMKNKIKEGEALGNILSSLPKLDSFKILQSESEQGGEVLESKVIKIRFDNVSTEIFNKLNISACVVEIVFFVMFTTYQNNVY
jgi:hypothetical protein